MTPTTFTIGGARLPVRLAYAALAWVVVFFAFHISWYLGSSFASPGELPGLPHSPVGWVFEVLVDAAWPLGVWVCLAIARGWPRGGLRRAASIVVWLACVVLVLRGAAGLIDDLTRATGLLPNGLTGLSTEQTTGVAHLTWSGWAIDAYFFAGGLLFGVLAYRYGGGAERSERKRSSDRRRSRSATTAMRSAARSSSGAVRATGTPASRSRRTSSMAWICQSRH